MQDVDEGIQRDAGAVRAAVAAARTGLVDRELIAEVVVLCAVAGEHLLVVGAPGTAKSEAVFEIPAAGPRRSSAAIVTTELPVPDRRLLVKALRGVDVRTMHGQVGLSDDEITWTVGGTPITVEQDARVLGLIRLNDVPTLITVSRSGLIVRAVSPGRTRTLTNWSGVERPIVHPTKPWIAVRRSPTAIDVGDLTTGETLLRVRSGA